MAEAVVIDGPALVQVDSGGGLENLGYSINGVEITETVFMLDVKGDQNGGDDGPPIDIQYLGQIDYVRIELSKFDILVLNKIRARLADASFSEGVTHTPGTLVANTAYYYRLLIKPTSNPRNYVAAIPRGQIQTAKGTKHQRPIVEFECHSFSGTLWNTAIV